MEFSNIKQNIDSKIENIYRDVIGDLKGIEKFSEIDSIIQLENIKINNLISTVETELINNFELEVVAKFGVEEAKKLARMSKFKLDKVEKLDISKEDIKKYKIIKQMREIENIKNDKTKKILGGTIAVGGILGGVIDKKRGRGLLIGGLIGLLTGAVVDYMREKEDIQTMESAIKVSVIDKDKLVDIVLKRKCRVEENIMIFITEIERVSKN